jgi:hypothetical protein
VSQHRAIYGQTEDHSSIIQGGTHSPHSRLANYTTSSNRNQFQGRSSQSYQGQGGLQFQPIPQSFSQSFQSLQFQPSNEMPPYAFACEQANSPWGQSISPQWSWHSNVPSSPSSQISTPQHTPRWGSLSPPPMPNPNRPQSSHRETHPQIPHTLLPSISSMTLDATHRGTLPYDPARPQSHSRASYTRGELASPPTVST